MSPMHMGCFFVCIASIQPLADLKEHRQKS